MNADRRRRFGAANRVLALLCECGEIDCHRTVVLTADEYDSLVPRMVVHPDHGSAEWPLLRDSDAAREAGGSPLELRHDDEPLS
jgi:hypothetical protein